MTEALTAAQAYVEFLSAFRYDAARPVEVAALGGSDVAMKLFNAMHGEESEVYLKLVEGLLVIPDPFAAGVLAVQLGGMVEQGANPHPLGDAMTRRLPGDFAAARRFAELLAADGVAEPDEGAPEVVAAAAAREPLGASAWAAQRMTTPAAMAAWCRHPLSRRVAAQLPSLGDDAAALGTHGGYAYFVGELLRSADGVPMLVLAPEQRKGFLLELVAVRNAAHLFALLEDALVGDPAAGLLEGVKLDPEIAAIARGEQMMEEEKIFSIGWHYEYWFGVNPEAAARITGLHPLIGAMIGVEAQLKHLPIVRRQAVILMKPRLVGSRTCKVSDFFAPLHDALRSGVLIHHELLPEEVDTTLAELRADADQVAAQG